MKGYEGSNYSLETALAHQVLAGQADAEYAYSCLVAFAMTKPPKPNPGEIGSVLAQSTTI